MTTIKWLAALFSFVSFGLLADAETPTVSADKILNDNSFKPVIIDVRSSKEFAKGRVPGAINMPYSDLATFESELTKYKKADVVVYCRSGYRARQAENWLKGKGFGKVWHLEGDMLDWQQSGRPIEQ